MHILNLELEFIFCFSEDMPFRIYSLNAYTKLQNTWDRICKKTLTIHGIIPPRFRYLLEKSNLCGWWPSAVCTVIETRYPKRRYSHLESGLQTLNIPLEEPLLTVPQADAYPSVQDMQEGIGRNASFLIFQSPTTI